MLWSGWVDDRVGKNLLQGWAERRVIDGLCATRGQTGTDWLYSDGAGESWQTAPCLCVRSVPWQQRQLTSSWAVLQGAWGKGLSSHSTLVGPHLDTVSFWAPQYRKGIEKMEKKNVRSWSTRFFQPGEEVASGGPDSSLLGPIWRTSKRWPKSSQRCMMGGWETQGINWKKKHSNWVSGKTFSPWGQSDIGAGYPENLCSLPPGKFSRLNWIKPWATWSDLTSSLSLSWVCTRDLLRSLSSWTILQAHYLWGSKRSQLRKEQRKAPLDLGNLDMLKNKPLESLWQEK